MDVKMAFLDGILEVEFYMDQPEGFVQTQKSFVHAWCHRIDSFFINEGFCRNQADHSFYVKQMCEYLLVAALYVDDLFILASNVTQLKWLKLEFKKEFGKSDLKKLYYCLGYNFRGIEKPVPSPCIKGATSNRFSKGLIWKNANRLELRSM